MQSVILRPAAELMPQVELVVARVYARLQQLLPECEVEHVGATSIPGAITKGDIDVVVRVSPAAFGEAVDMLTAHFAVKQQSNWTSDFASFGDDSGYGLPVGIQLVAIGAEVDFITFLRNHLVANPEALAAYNQLKCEHAEAGPEAYWRAKNSFISEILASRVRPQPPIGQ